MKIRDTVALVTGANRGIGLAFTQELLARGARKVYAGVRDPSTIKHLAVEALRLDVTQPEEIVAAAAHASDVALLINNAGAAHLGGFLAPDSEEVARFLFETNFFGVLRMSKAFAPILAANGGGAVLNVLSVASWLNRGQLAAYAASKSAAWSLTNSLRYELAAQRTQVLALHMGFVDTDLAREIESLQRVVRTKLWHARSTPWNPAPMRCLPTSAAGWQSRHSRHCVLVIYRRRVDGGLIGYLQLNRFRTPTEPQWGRAGTTRHRRKRLTYEGR